MISNFAELAKARGDLARHATLVGAWTAIARRTGAGLGLIVQTNEGRAVFEDIPEADRAELERGLAMNDADVVSYALESSPTRVT